MAQHLPMTSMALVHGKHKRPCSQAFLLGWPPSAAVLGMTSLGSASVWALWLGQAPGLPQTLVLGSEMAGLD